MVAGRRLPEVQVRHGGRPRGDVGRQQCRILHQSIDERALAGLDLAYHRDPAHLLLENARGFVDEGLPGGLENGCERLSASEQLLSERLQRRADSAEPCRRRHRRAKSQADAAVGGERGTLVNFPHTQTPNCRRNS